MRFESFRSLEVKGVKSYFMSKMDNVPIGVKSSAGGCILLDKDQVEHIKISNTSNGEEFKDPTT